MKDLKNSTGTNSVELNSSFHNKKLNTDVSIYDISKHLFKQSTCSTYTKSRNYATANTHTHVTHLFIIIFIVIKEDCYHTTTAEDSPPHIQRHNQFQTCTLRPVNQRVTVQYIIAWTGTAVWVVRQFLSQANDATTNNDAKSLQRLCEKNTATQN